MPEKYKLDGSKGDPIQIKKDARAYVGIVNSNTGEVIIEEQREEEPVHQIDKLKKDLSGDWISFTIDPFDENTGLRTVRPYTFVEYKHTLEEMAVVKDIGSQINKQRLYDDWKKQYKEWLKDPERATERPKLDLPEWIIRELEAQELQLRNQEAMHVQEEAKEEAWTGRKYPPSPFFEFLQNKHTVTVPRVIEDSEAARNLFKKYLEEGWKSYDMEVDELKEKDPPQFFVLTEGGVKEVERDFLPESEASIMLTQLRKDNPDNLEPYFELVRKLAKEEPPREFIFTQGVAKEVDKSKEIKIQVSVAIQVVNNVFNLYYWTDPKYQDLYSQQFRNRGYDMFAECHSHLDRSCPRYYRGSNAIHIKLMHFLEKEALQNHNHHRLLGNEPFTPAEFRQLMEGIKKPIHKEVREELFTLHKILKDGTDVGDEIEWLCKRYEKYYHEWTNTLDAEGKTKAQRNAEHPARRLTTGDLVEFRLFGWQQEPCRIAIEVIDVDYNKVRAQIDVAIENARLAPNSSQAQIQQLLEDAKKIDKEYQRIKKFKEGNWGLSSDKAFTRQVSDSTMPSVPLPAEEGIEFEIPEWATNFQDSAKKSMKSIFLKEDFERIKMDLENKIQRKQEHKTAQSDSEIQILTSKLASIQAEYDHASAAINDSRTFTFPEWAKQSKKFTQTIDESKNLADIRGFEARDLEKAGVKVYPGTMFTQKGKDSKTARPEGKEADDKWAPGVEGPD